MIHGRSISKAEEITTRSIGKALLGVVGLGIASGVAIVAGTNLIMSKLFPEGGQEEEAED